MSFSDRIKFHAQSLFFLVLQGCLYAIFVFSVCRFEFLIVKYSVLNKTILQKSGNVNIYFFKKCINYRNWRINKLNIWTEIKVTRFFSEITYHTVTLTSLWPKEFSPLQLSICSSPFYLTLSHELQTPYICIQISSGHLKPNIFTSEQMYSPLKLLILENTFCLSSCLRDRGGRELFE